MKISNEFKIGVLAVVAVAGLILGFNFLKGSSVFHHDKKLYAVFDNVDGLDLSNPVLISGLQIDRAVLFSTAIIVAAFIPLFTMWGVEGQIFSPMARTYGYALVARRIGSPGSVGQLA